MCFPSRVSMNTLRDMIIGAIDGDKPLQAAVEERLAARGAAADNSVLELFTLNHMTYIDCELGKRRARYGFQWAASMAMQCRPFSAQLLRELRPDNIALPYFCDAAFLTGDLLRAQRHVVESCLTPLYQSGRIDARTLVDWISAALAQPKLLSAVDVFVAQNWLAATATPRVTAFRSFLEKVSLLILHRGATSCIFTLVDCT